MKKDSCLQAWFVTHGCFLADSGYCVLQYPLPWGHKEEMTPAGTMSPGWVLLYKQSWPMERSGRPYWQVSSEPWQAAESTELHSAAAPGCREVRARGRKQLGGASLDACPTRSSFYPSAPEMQSSGRLQVPSPGPGARTCSQCKIYAKENIGQGWANPGTGARVCRSKAFCLACTSRGGRRGRG